MALRRPYVIDESVYIPAPVGGWNPDGNPWELPANQAPILDNALVRPGRVVVRGSLTNWADLSAITLPAPPLNVGGVQPLPGSTKLAIGRKAVSATAYVDPWFAPIVRPAAAATLAAPTADMAVASGGTTLSNTATAANLQPGPRGISFEGTRYYLSYGAATSGVADAGGTFFALPVALCTINASGTPTALTNAPRGGIDIKGYQSRIWMLGGIDDPASGTTFNPLRLLYTNPIGPGGGNAASYADWKDPIAGTTNQILMDGDTTDPGVGLAVVRNGLLVFRASSIWILRGTTSASYTLQPVTRQVGCVDPRSIVETDNGTFFMSRQGLMLTDGVVVRNVSGTALNTLQQAVSLVSGAIKSSFGGYITGAVTSGGQLVFSMGVASVTSSAPDGHLQPVWAGMYDPAQNVWIRVTSALFAADGTIVSPGNNYPGWVFNTPDLRLLSIGDKYITQWESEFASTTVTPFTAANLPTAATNDASVGSLAWSNPTNAEVADGVNATAGVSNFMAASYLTSTAPTQTGGGTAWTGLVAPTNNVFTSYPTLGSCPTATLPSGGSTSEMMVFSHGGLSIPSTAKIVAMSFNIQGGNFGGPGTATWSVAQWVKAGSAVGNNFAGGQAFSSNPTYTRFLDTTTGLIDGAAWTPADVNSTSFGVGVIAAAVGGAATGAVSRIQFQVYYTDGYELLKATAYGYAVPSNATITGIQVTAAVSSTGGQVYDDTVKLYKAGVLGSTNRAAFNNWPTSPVTLNYGGSSDLWGTTWTPADINNAGFGVGITAYNSANNAGIHSDTAQVDYVRVTVYYTLTNTTSQQSFVKQPALYDKDAAGNFQPIPFRWRTQLYPIVGTGGGLRKVVQLKRFFVDYILQGLGLPSTNGFSVTPVDDTGTLLPGAASIQLAPTNNSMSNGSVSGGPPIPSAQIERLSSELNSEATDMAMDISFTDTQQASQPSAVAAEIYGVGIDALPGRPLHDAS